jgi:hypothetical protein
MNLTELKLFSADGTLTLDSASWGPGGVTGADKVANRLIYALLTPQGSVPGRPSDGSPFTELLVGFNTDFDVHTAFLTSLPSAVTTVQQAETEDEPDSEKYGGCRLDGMDIAGDGLTLHLSVAAKDGSLPTYPVSFTVPT